VRLGSLDAHEYAACAQVFFLDPEGNMIEVRRQRCPMCLLMSARSTLWQNSTQ